MRRVKRCPKCGETKPLDEFCKDKARKDGRDGVCRACRAAYQQGRRQSESGQVAIHNYEQSEAGRAVRRGYRQSDKGRAANRVAHRKYSRSDKGRVAQRRRRSKYPGKLAARAAVKTAIRSGKLVRGPCGVCGAASEEERIEGHHDDYSKPLDVRWLCEEHHREAER